MSVLRVPESRARAYDEIIERLRALQGATGDPREREAVKYAETKLRDALVRIDARARRDASTRR